MSLFIETLIIGSQAIFGRRKRDPKGFHNFDDLRIVEIEIETVFSRG